MKKILLVLVILLAAAALLVGGAILAAPRFLQTELFKKNLETHLSLRFQREIRISGDLAFHFFPWVGFAATDLSVSDVEGSRRPAVVTCALADIRLELLPLLEKRVVFNEIHLEKVSLRLIRDRFGRTNWQDLVGGLSRTSSSTMANPPFVLERVDEVHIRRSTLAYIDEPRGLTVSVENFELDRRGVVQRTFHLAGALRIEGPYQAGFTRLSGRLEMSGDAFVDTRQRRLGIIASTLSFPFELTGPDNRPPLAGALTAQLSGDTTRETLALKKVSLLLNAGSVSGNLHAEELLNAPRIKGRIDVACPDVRALWASLAPSVNGDGLPPGPLALGFSYAADDQGVNLDDVSLRMAGVDATGTVGVTGFHQPRIVASLTAETIDLAPWLSEETSVETETSVTPNDFCDGDWNLDLKLSAGRVSAKEISVADLELHALAGRGRLTVRPLTFGFAGGQVSGGVDAASLDPSTVVKAAFRFEDLPAASLWQLAEKRSPMTARLNGEVNLIAEGERFDTLGRSLSGTVRLDAPKGLVVNAAGEKPGEEIRLSEASAVLAAYAQESPGATEKNRLVRSFSMDLKGKAAAPQVSGSIKAFGTVSLSPDLGDVTVSATEFLARFQGKSLGPVSPLDLDGAGAYDLRTGALSLDRVAFDGLGLSGSGRLTASGLSKNRVIAGHVRVNNFDPHTLARRLGFDLPPRVDPGVLQHAQGTADFQFESGDLLLDRLAVVVDDTHVDGSAVMRFQPGLQAGFLLHADRVDLDRYDAAHDAGTEPARDATGKRNQDGRPLRNARIHGVATFDHLRVADIHLEGPDLAVDLEKQTLELRLRTAELYGGAAAGHGMLHWGDEALTGSATVNLRAVELTGLLTDMFHWVPISGFGALDLSLSGEGNDFDGLIRGLRGQAEVSITNGAIHGIRAVPESVSGPSEPGAAKQEPFDSIFGTVSIDNGVLTSTDGVLSARYLQARGTGSLNLFTDVLDYAVTADIQGLPVVTYTFQGPLDDIRVELDRIGFAQEAAKGVLKSPFKLGKGTLNLGTDILEAGKEAIGDRTGPQRMGQGALGMGQGILEIGKGIVGMDGKAMETVGTGAKAVGQGIVDVGRGAVDTGRDVLEGIGGGLQKIFSGNKKEKAPGAEEDSAPAP